MRDENTDLNTSTGRQAEQRGGAGASNNAPSPQAQPDQGGQAQTGDRQGVQNGQGQPGQSEGARHPSGQGQGGLSQEGSGPGEQRQV